MKIKTILKIFIILLPVFLTIWLGISVSKQAIISSGGTGQWAFSLGSVWMSSNKVGNIQDNDWFSMARIGDTLVTAETNIDTGFYSIHYNLGKGGGWKLLIETPHIIPSEFHFETT